MPEYPHNDAKPPVRIGMRIADKPKYPHTDAIPT